MVSEILSILLLEHGGGLPGHAREDFCISVIECVLS